MAPDTSNRGSIAPNCRLRLDNMPGRICSWGLIPTIFLLFGCVSSGTGTKSSSSRIIQSLSKVTPTSGTEVHPSPIASVLGDTGFHGLLRANFYQRILGDHVVE